jgi:hypothetical protein
MALSSRLARDNLMVLKGIDFRTSNLRFAGYKSLDWKKLIVSRKWIITSSFGAHLPGIKLLPADKLNAYDVAVPETGHA